MAIQGMNHFTILTDNVEATRTFYCDLLGFEAGERPDFRFPGTWLYVKGEPVLHVIGGKPRSDLIAGVLDHMAFTATDLLGTLKKLEARGLKYELRRLPSGPVNAWQLFFNDPNNARVELDFDGREAGPA